MPPEPPLSHAAAPRRCAPRTRIAGIVVHRGAVLVQRPAQDPSACYAFIGGEYEIGDSFDSRLRQEFEEETNARVVACAYLFCVENRFEEKGAPVQQVEHYFSVTLDRFDIVSREDHLAQHWLPLADILAFDLRPAVVRTALADGSYRTVRHLVQGRG